MDEKILIVDDEENILKTCQRVLLEERYSCTVFSSPTKALKAAKRINPAIVISDQRMPGMTGIEFLENIKKRLPEAVRVIMTGYADINVAISAINRGQVFRFIKKPWDDELFKLEIRHAVENYRMTQRLQKSLSGMNKNKAIEKERLQGVLEMAGAVCHEFAQPLQVISGYCDLAAFPDEPTDKNNLNEFISCIQQQVEVLGNLLLKVMAIEEYKTRSYAEGCQIVDIHRASSVESIPYSVFNNKLDK